MIKLFGHREMIPLIVIFAVGGLGLWVGANQGGTEVIDAIAVILFALALLLAVVSAVAYRSKVLARRRANMWFDLQGDHDTCAYLVVDRDLTIRAASERFRRWFGHRIKDGSQLGDLWQGKFDWQVLQASLAETYEGVLAGSQRAAVGFSTHGQRVYWPIENIVVPMMVSSKVVDQAQGAIVLRFEPEVSAIGDTIQPTSSEFYGLLMESSLSAKVVIDDEGIVVDFNPAAQALLGFTRSEMIGCVMSDHIIPGRYQQAHNEGIARFLASGQGPVITRRVELPALHKDGFELPIELTINALQTEHGIFFAAEMRDLRDWHALEHDMRIAREEAEQANQSKSRFLATMSHEVRTPLNALLGILSLVAADEKDAHQLSLLATAESAGQRLMGLLTNILDYSKIEAGEMAQQRLVFSPAATVQDVMDLYALAVRDGKVVLSCDVSAAKNLWIVGDPEKVAQIVTNLVSNAVKFTERGSIELVLECDPADAATPSYRVKVRDSGIGMTEVERNRIFDAFVQVDDSDRRKYLGSGLGLSISKQLAELMNGSLRVTSVPNQGSEFILTLPLTVAAKPVHSRETAPPELINSRRILVAEDSKPNQLVVQTMLERQGYVVDVANDGIEACAAVKGNAPEDTPYCLILMDVQMPGMDGIEATRWIRNNGHSLPIVALTAKAFMEDEKACLEAGMNDFMTKPVNYEALLARVDMWLGDKSTQPSTLPGEKVSEMRVLMGEEAFKDALGVLSQEVSERHVTLHKILAEGDYAKASAELHTLFGIYAGYGFEELQHLARALQDSCDAKLTPPAKSLQHFDELSSELLHKIKRYRAETMA